MTLKYNKKLSKKQHKLSKKNSKKLSKKQHKLSKKNVKNTKKKTKKHYNNVVEIFHNNHNHNETHHNETHQNNIHTSVSIVPGMKKYLTKKDF